MPPELTTILGTDIVGDRLTADERDTEPAVLSNIEEILADCVVRFHGRVVNFSVETCLLAEFSNTLDAVGCAVEIQRDLADRSEIVPASRQTRLRIGVNHETLPPGGETSAIDKGDSVARLVALAEPGGICISRTVYDEVRSHLKLQYDTKRDPKHTAFLCQEIRQKWDELNLLELSAVRIGPAELIGESSNGATVRAPFKYANGLIHKIMALFDRKITRMVGGQRRG